MREEIKNNMGFFEKMNQAANDLGKKTQDFASDTKTKADNAIQISKLNGKINDKKRENESLKIQIGTAYFEMASTGNTSKGETLNALVEKMKANLDEIDSLNKQIGEIKIKEAGGGKLCPKCGSVVAENAKFCTKCGYKFEEVHD